MWSTLLKLNESFGSRLDTPRGNHRDVCDFRKGCDASEQEHAHERLPQPGFNRNCIQVAHQARSGEPDEHGRDQENQAVDPERIVLRS